MQDSKQKGANIIMGRKLSELRKAKASMPTKEYEEKLLKLHTEMIETEINNAEQYADRNKRKAQHIQRVCSLTERLLPNSINKKCGRRDFFTSVYYYKRLARFAEEKAEKIRKECDKLGGFMAYHKACKCDGRKIDIAFKPSSELPVIHGGPRIHTLCEDTIVERKWLEDSTDFKRAYNDGNTDFLFQ